MSAMFWKSAALLGVIGVGSVVVWQAQKNLQTVTNPGGVAAEEFEELELDTEGEGETATPDLAPGSTAAAANALAALDPAAAGLPGDAEADPFGTESETSEVNLDESTAGAAPWSRKAPAETAEETESELTADAADLAAAEGDFGEEPAGDGADAEVTLAADETNSPGGLRRMNPEVGGPVLMQAPNLDETTDEEAPAEGFEAEEPAADNPFAKFHRNSATPDVSTPPLPSVDTALAETKAAAASAAEESPAADPVNDPPAADAPARSSIPPETKSPAATASNAGTEMDSVPRRAAEEPAVVELATEESSEPAVVSPARAGLGISKIPDLPTVGETLAPETHSRESAAPNDAAVVQVEGLEEEAPAGSSIPDLPQVNVAAGERPENEAPQINPAAGAPHLRSSIPGQTAELPPEASESQAPAREFSTNVDEQTSIDFPVLEADPAPAVKPSKVPDLVGNGVIDRDVAPGPSQPQMTVTKQAPSEAVVGQDLEYSILVKNNGRSAAHNVVVEDQIPRGSECTGTAPKCESENKKLIWRLGTMAPGAEQVLRVRITPTTAGEIGSIATVSFSAEVAAKTVIVEPKAEIVVSGPREMIVGEPGQYKFVLSNNGSVDLKGVFIRTVLPEGLDHAGGRDLEYEVGDLPRGKSKEIPITLQAAKAGAWQNMVQITQRGRELARTTSDINVIDSRLVINRTGPARRFVGRPATFTNTVTNTSSQPLTNVTIVETLPEGLEPAGQVANGRWDPARRTITWFLPQLAGGAASDLSYTIAPKAAGKLTGRVAAMDAAGNKAEVPTTLDVAGFSSLAVDVEHDGRPIPVGEQVSMRFNVKNRGTAAAAKVQAAFELPEEVLFINAQGPAKFERVGNLIVFNEVPTVPVGGDLQFDVVFQAVKPTPADGDRRVRVSLHSDQLSKEKPLEQQQQIVIFGEDGAEADGILQTSGTR